MRQRIDMDDAATERDCADDVVKQRTRLKDDKSLLENPEFQTYEGRLRTFVRPISVVLPDSSEVKLGGWPHGYHRLSDRPGLSALLKQEAIRCTGSAKDLKFNDRLQLQGFIPIFEGFAYVRYGDSSSFRWDRLYLEIRQIHEGAAFDEIFLTWGDLDPFNVHMTKFAVKTTGYFNVAKMTKVSCVSLSSKEVEIIRSQHDDLLALGFNLRTILSRVKGLFGLKIETGQDDMKIAFLEESKCKECEQNLIRNLTASPFPSARISVGADPPPATLVLSGELKHQCLCLGAYTLVAGRSAHGGPVWRHECGDRYIAQLASGNWAVQKEEKVGVTQDAFLYLADANVMSPHQSRVAWQETDDRGRWFAGEGLKCEAVEISESKARRAAGPGMQRMWRLSPEIMASSGFVFSPLPMLGQIDRVLCPFCGIELHGFKQDDDISDLHHRANPKCPFVQGKHTDKDGGRALVHGVGSADPSVARSTSFSGSKMRSQIVLTQQSNLVDSLVSGPGLQTAIQAVFDKFDKDGSGAIDREEFGDAMLQLGLRHSSADVDMLFRAYDTDGGGEIDLKEFANIARSLVASKSSRQGRNCVLVPPDPARRKFLGVKDDEQHDCLVFQLDQAAVATKRDKTLFTQQTQAVPHQNALMQHRRRMYTVMDGEEGGMLLEFAAANNIEGVKKMLDQGAPIDFADGGMRTSLHWAVAFGNNEVVQLLLDRGLVCCPLSHRTRACLLLSHHIPATRLCE